VCVCVCVIYIYICSVYEIISRCWQDHELAVEIPNFVIFDLV
jgi:hypothetical protein